MKAIPTIEQPNSARSLEPCKSYFVELKDNKFFDVCLKYPKMNFQNATDKCMVRKEVYDKLKIAAKSLPDGIHLRIWDAWRPFLLQEELYNDYSQFIIEKYNLDLKTKKEREFIISKFISPPTKNRNFPPVHTTGGAVDVTLVDENGKELDMGTEFDEFSDLTETSFFENSQNDIIRNNRRILYNAMIKAGFTNLPSEWWHYDYGNRFWAYYKNKPAIYEGIFKIGEMKINETKEKN